MDISSIDWKIVPTGECGWQCVQSRLSVFVSVCLVRVVTIESLDLLCRYS